MRIIGGDLGGRRLHPPSKMPHTRPTTDMAKEGLFNILQNNLDFEGLRTLELFGGTGNISYELASRGAADLTVVEKDPAMAAFIGRSAGELGLKNLHVIRQDVFKYLHLCTESFDFIFADPPYALETMDELPGIIAAKELLKPDGWFVLEHEYRNDYREFPRFAAHRQYGTTVFSIFVNKIA